MSQSGWCCCNAAKSERENDEGKLPAQPSPSVSGGGKPLPDGPPQLQMARTPPAVCRPEAWAASGAEQQVAVAVSVEQSLSSEAGLPRSAMGQGNIEPSDSALAMPRTVVLPIEPAIPSQTHAVLGYFADGGGDFADGGCGETSGAWGICAGCSVEVARTDTMQAQHGKYFHVQCVRGLCGGCGRVVHISSQRERRDGVYWHTKCTPTGMMMLAD
jgi:hypothetical protein